MKAHLWNEKPVCVDCLKKFESGRPQIDFDKWCRRCKNYEFNMQSGILCAITHEKPDFEEECKDYQHDISREEKIKTEQRKELISNKKKRTIDKLSVPKPVKILGWLEIIFNLPLLLLSLTVFFSFLMFQERTYVGALFMWALIIVLLTGMTILGILLKNGNSVSRIIMIVLYIVRLIGFPIGTLWGAYGIYYLAFDEKVKNYYSEKRQNYS
jgi:hypothetical protein